ncbi:MAG: GDP-mannose 4,6-dehydratase [Nanoarchaeota archaeon]
MHNKNILITGGAGFIASNLTRKIIHDNKITLFVKPQTDLQRILDIKNHVNIKIIYGNLTDKELLTKIIQDKDYLFHFAWQTDLKKSMLNPVQDLQQDIISLIQVLEICKNINPAIKIIFTSAVTVIGEASKIPSNEEEKENPLSVYDLHKLIAEKYLQLYYKNYKIKSCSLRLSNVFGEYQKIDNPNRGVLNFMIGRALRNEPLTVYGDGEFIRDYCYVQNYVDAFIAAATHENTDGEVFVLGSGQGKTMNQVVEKIKEIVEELTTKKVTIQHIPFPEGDHRINKRNFIVDHSKFSKATGWQPQISFENGLRKTIEFYLKNLSSE